jgi:hypothetical protein
MFAYPQITSPPFVKGGEGGFEGVKLLDDGRLARLYSHFEPLDGCNPPGIFSFIVNVIKAKEDEDEWCPCCSGPG